jgi:DNA replication protein DnaC
VHHKNSDPPHPLAPSRDYLSLPTLLLADMADSPLAIGLWCLVGRLFLVAQGAVPLSAGDVQAYDPALSRGAILRALRRLTRTGWLLAREQPGHKTAYTPAWGIVSDAPRAWDMAAPMLGRPRHCAAIRLDRRLLDTCIGRLTPHPKHKAEVQRYVTAPLLGLADVGAYALAAVGRGAATPALGRWGLAADRKAHPLPAKNEFLARLSLASAIDPDAPALTIEGLRHLGFAVQPAAPPADTGQPLVFVPQHLIGPLIGPLIGHLIGQHADQEVSSAASESGKTPLSTEPAIIPGNLGNLGSQGIPPQPPQLTVRSGEGRHYLPDMTEEEAATGRPVPSTQKTQQPMADVSPENDTISLLRALGVRAAAAHELADAPAATVREAIATGRRQPGVRDLAGWVVSVLRDARGRGWQTVTAEAPAPAGAPPTDLAAQSVEHMLACALAEVASPPVLPPEDDVCYCDGSGYYLLDVPYDHPQWSKLQICPCTRSDEVYASLARQAGPQLAGVSLATFRTDDQPTHSVTWAGQTFTPAEQAATRLHALVRCATLAGSLTRGACLVGPVGSGKTTLAVAAAKELAVRHGLRLRYASIPKLLDDLRHEAMGHTSAASLSEHIAAPVLVLDDLGREKFTAFAREKLYLLLDERLRRHTEEEPRITFFTSNLSFAELYALDAALASRIAAHAEIMLCIAPDYRLQAITESQGVAA